MTILNAVEIKFSININCGPTQLTEGGLKELNKIHTEEFFSQHAQLLPVEAVTSEGGKLPAEDLGELAPGGPRRVTEERQVLSTGKVVLKTLIRSHVHIITANHKNHSNGGSPWVHQSEGCTT